METQLVLSVAAYVLSSFVVQAASHFVLNKAHYAQVAYMRREPIFRWGIAAMLIQGACLASLFYSLPHQDAGFGQGILFAWRAGAVLVSYIALAEPAKYAVPSTPAWILVESSSGFVQFTLYGVMLDFIRRGV